VGKNLITMTPIGPLRLRQFTDSTKTKEIMKFSQANVKNSLQ